MVCRHGLIVNWAGVLAYFNKVWLWLVMTWTICNLEYLYFHPSHYFRVTRGLRPEEVRGARRVERVSRLSVTVWPTWGAQGACGAVWAPTRGGGTRVTWRMTRVTNPVTAATSGSTLTQVRDLCFFPFWHWPRERNCWVLNTMWCQDDRLTGSTASVCNAELLTFDWSMLTILSSDWSLCNADQWFTALGDERFTINYPDHWVDPGPIARSLLCLSEINFPLSRPSEETVWVPVSGHCFVLSWCAALTFLCAVLRALLSKDIQNI